MADEARVDTQETTETAPVAEETVASPEKTEKVGEVMQTAKAPNTVGLDKFLDVKKDNKELRKDIADLKKLIESGATKQEVSADISSIADEYGVDKDFLAKLSSTIRAQADEAAEAKLKPFQEKEREEKVHTAFSKAFKDSMERMPEYEAIVNPDVIKALSLDPRNADKTFDDIIQDAYSSAIQGKRTIETTTPGGGKNPEPIDFTKASKDPAYFDSIMANPTMKAEYNKDLERRLRL